jgi:hypothetical protein
MNATGYWDVGDYGSTPWFSSGLKEDNPIEENDIKILRDLAEKVAVIAERPEQKEKRGLWRGHNSLKATRPLIICDPENGWNEVITKDMIQCRNRLARNWEIVLRKEIFWGDILRDDKPIEKNFDINYSFHESDWGIDIEFKQEKEGGSYIWIPGLKNRSDIKKLKYPEITVDHETTNKTVEMARDILGEFLDVRLIGKWWWGTGLTYDFVTLRGMEQFMMDMVTDPDFVHSVMEILKNGTIAKIDFLEELGVLSLNNDLYVPAGGFGYTDELPRKDFDGHVTTMDLWGYAESQETVGVSPEMFAEFIFPYQKEIQSRFGLNSYGCCEPLHSRWHIIKDIPRLRKVTVSPWADRKLIAEYLGNDYCYCWKPNPAYLAVKELDQEKIRKDIRETFQITRDCRVEVLMQDNHTIGNNPDNIITWTSIAKEEAERIAS